jgi:RNA polymerase sigma factor (sigma-70 family)
MTVLSDDRLAQQATKGDERAFAAIYRRYHQDLYRFCLAIVRNPQDAQDALQNAMVKVLRALPGEERRIELKPWLYRIAHNEAIELLRRRRPAEHVDPETAAAPASSPAEAAEHRERLRKLLADLEELPDRQRGALVMRELAGFGFGEIAAAFDTSDAVARQTVYEARLSLRQMEAGREMSCKKAMWELSEADGRVTRRRDIQAHLRGCPECRAFRDSIAGRRRDLAAIAPLPLAASAGLLHGLLGGNVAAGAGAAGAGTGAGAAASGGVGAGVAGAVTAGAGTSAGTAASGGLAGTVAVGAGKAVATSAILKSAATVAVVAAVGVSAADRGGLIDTPLSGGGDTRSSSPGAGAPATTPASGASAGQNVESGEPDHANGKREANRGGVQRGNSRQARSTKASSGGHGEKGRSQAKGQNRSEGLPATSNHGQQTASAHPQGNSKNAKAKGGGSNGRGKSSGHTNSKGGSRGHTSRKGHSTRASHASGGGRRGGGSTSATPKSGTPRQPGSPSASAKQAPPSSAGDSTGQGTSAETPPSEG